MKAIGFLHGLAGDAVMCTAACREFKKMHPDAHLTFALSKGNAKILELFKGHPDIDAFHVWDNDGVRMSENDVKFIKDNNFDIVFNPFANHTSQDWYNHFHYIHETLLMLGFPINKHFTSTQLYLPAPTDQKQHSDDKLITIAAWPSAGAQLDKTPSLDNWVRIVSFLKDKGYRVVQLGGRFDLEIEGAERNDLSFKESAILLYTSKLSITTDTSWAWIASAYEHNNIGLYKYNYIDQNNIENHLPTNKNSSYLYGKNFDNIDIESVIEAIKNKI